MATFKENLPDLVLVSTSPYRQELLRRLGLPFRAVPPRFEETHYHQMNPAQLALELARGKAMSVAKDFPNAILIGSDQVVWFNHRHLIKPGNAERAFLELQSLRGQMHEFHTALFLFHTGLQAEQAFVVKGAAKLRADLTDAELRRYIEIDDPVNCAGSAKIENTGIMLFECIECEDWNAIIGLPLIALTTALRRWDYPIFHRTNE